MQRVILLFATGLGLGYIPGAPGTYGSILGIPLAVVFFRQGPLLGTFSLVAFVLFSTWTAGKAEEIFRQPDPSRVVIDEVAGMALTLFLVSPATGHIIIGFVLFRIFDMVKFGPVKWANDRLKGGIGIVADDLIAGVISNLLLRLILLVW